jgi:hypothetical protein
MTPQIQQKQIGNRTLLTVRGRRFEWSAASASYFMIGWFRLSEFEKAERIVDTNAADLAAAVEPAEAPTPKP